MLKNLSKCSKLSTDPCVQQELKDLDHVDDGALNLRHATRPPSLKNLNLLNSHVHVL